jgi:iron complex transport system ATP-binding protein
MLEAGRIAADGPAAEVLSDPLLSRVFGIRGHHAETPDGPVFQPLAITR